MVESSVCRSDELLITSEVNRNSSNSRWRRALWSASSCPAVHSVLQGDAVPLPIQGDLTSLFGVDLLKKYLLLKKA